MTVAVARPSPGTSWRGWRTDGRIESAVRSRSSRGSTQLGEDVLTLPLTLADRHTPPHRSRSRFRRTRSTGSIYATTIEHGCRLVTQDAPCGATGTPAARSPLW